MVTDVRNRAWTEPMTPRVARLRERLMAEMLAEPACWNLDGVSLVRENPGLAGLSADVRYAMAIARMLAELPITIDEDELIVGDMPRRTRFSLVPLPDYLTDEERRALGDEYMIFVGKSPMGHYAADYAGLLQKGLRGVRAEARATLSRLRERGDWPAREGRDFCEGVLVALDDVGAFAARYAALARSQATAEQDARRRSEMEEIARVCAKVPEQPAESFREALQSVYLYHAVLQIVQQDAALGRLDQVFAPYYLADVAAGRLTVDEAQELVDCFIMKLNDFVVLHTDDYWGTMEPGLQNVILSGKSADGRDTTNDLTYLFLNSLRRLKLNNPTISVRLHKQSPQPLIRACSEVLRSGGGFPALYNDEVMVPGLIRAGIPEGDAYAYANDGCWETTIPGKTRFSYLSVSAPLCLEWTLTRGRGLPIDWRQAACLKLEQTPVPAGADEVSLEPPRALCESEEWRQQRKMQMFGRYQPISQLTVDARQGGIDVGDPLGFATFEDLFAAVCRQLDYATADLVQRLWSRWQLDFVVVDGKQLKPNLVGAALVSDCLALGRGWTAGGPRYTIFGLCFYGVANLADSLLAIKKLVFEERVLTMERLLGLLETNFENAEPERQLLLTRAPHYGDGSAEGAAMTRRLLDFIVDSAARHTSALALPEEFAGRTFWTLLCGTFGNTVFFGRMVGASPDGRFAGQPIAVNLSPMVGTGAAGPTAILRSYAELPLETLNAGAPLDLSIDGSALTGEEGLARLMAFVRGFIELGGQLLTISLVDAQTLRRAQSDPNSYRDLRVRMGGWNAYFVGLNREEQAHQIARAEHRAL